jgi:signal transduction histidine kinase
MTTIYLGERGVPEEVATALETAGFRLVRGEAPPEADPGDFSLVPATEGVTSTLRHALGNQLTAILGFSELLLRRPDLAVDARKGLATIRDGARACREFLHRREVRS